jgi:hypothetical protein
MQGGSNSTLYSTLSSGPLGGASASQARQCAPRRCASLEHCSSSCAACCLRCCLIAVSSAHHAATNNMPHPTRVSPCQAVSATSKPREANADQAACGRLFKKCYHMVPSPEVIRFNHHVGILPHLARPPVPPANLGKPMLIRQPVGGT